MKQVTKAEFDEAIAAYPRPLHEGDDYKEGGPITGKNFRDLSRQMERSLVGRITYGPPALYEIDE